MITGQQRFQHVETTVDVREGAVSLCGTFSDSGAVLALKHQVAETEGVIRLESMAWFAP
jgi:hypothetical protein